MLWMDIMVGIMAVVAFGVGICAFIDEKRSNKENN